MTKPKAVKEKTGPKTDWKLTDEVVRKLEDSAAMGCTIEEMCLYSDISKDTYYRWLKKNPKLSERLELLQFRPILQARNSVIQAMKNDGNLALKFLERKRKAEFSTQQQIDHTTNGKDLPAPILGGLSVQSTEASDE